jgi:chromosome segregation ATPase
MGLFTNKKEEKKPTVSTDQFPEFPDMNEGDIPSYQPTIADIKKEIGKGMEDEEEVEVPIRQKPEKTMASASQEVSFKFESPRKDLQEMPSSEKPLFVKINNYKTAIENLDDLKKKLSEADHLLNEIEDIKKKEDEKLESWKNNLQKLKEKLSSIDQNLFEV